MDWLKYRLIYFAISLTAIAVGVYSLYSWGLNLGVDFKGGTILEYKFEKDISTEQAIENIGEEGIEITTVQNIGEATYLFKLPAIELKEKEQIKNAVSQITDGDIDEIRFETVGPSIGPELVKKTIYAVTAAASVILLWVAIQFKSLKFGASAILAMFHDSFILIGAFSLLGYLMQVEIDFLFVTALLTTLSFSVHDTIVVYDRIRESQKVHADDLKVLANKAISETMVRSLNNSFTIIFMLVALILLGGTTIKWFAVALFVGTILGTYSSPFVAVPLLVTWDDIVKKIKRRK